MTHTVLCTKDEKCMALYPDSAWAVRMKVTCPAQQMKLRRVLWGEESLISPAVGEVPHDSPRVSTSKVWEEELLIWIWL